MSFRIRPLGESDRALAEVLWSSHWGGLTMVSGGREHHVDALAGFLAEDEQTGHALGLLTYLTDHEERTIELISLNSLDEGRGVGTALVCGVQALAAERGQRLSLFTTNDNLPAARFHLRRGFRLVAVHKDAVTRARALKPAIPEVGLDGQPLRDEWEWEWVPGGSELSGRE